MSSWPLLLLLLLLLLLHLLVADACPPLHRPAACAERRSVIFVPGGSGYEDRLYTFELFATLANFLCARVYSRRPWEVLVPFFNKDGHFVNKSLDWVDFFSHHESYCGEENLPRSLTWKKYNYMYEAQKRQHILYKAIPVRDVAINLKIYSGYNKPFDFMLDDNVRISYYKKKMLHSLIQVLKTRKTGQSFLWSVHQYDLYYQRSQLADMIEDAVYRSGTQIRDYATRYTLPTSSQNLAKAFMLKHALVKNKIIVLHIRRAKDAIKHYGCPKASPEDVREFIVKFTSHCASVFPPGYTIAFHTDEYDTEFLNEVAVQIRNLGYVPFHIDSMLDSFLQERIASGQLEARQLNNYFIYAIILSIRKNQLWRLDIHRPNATDLQRQTSGSCQQGYWDPLTCLPIRTVRTYHDRSYDLLWTYNEHLPPNRSASVYDATSRGSHF